MSVFKIKSSGFSRALARKDCSTTHNGYDDQPVNFIVAGSRTRESPLVGVDGESDSVGDHGWRQTEHIFGVPKDTFPIFSLLNLSFEHYFSQFFGSGHLLGWWWITKIKYSDKRRNNTRTHTQVHTYVHTHTLTHVCAHIHVFLIISTVSITPSLTYNRWNR